MIHYALLAAAILFGVAGQLLLKTGADAGSILEQFMRPVTILGLGAYGMAGLLYTLALRGIPVSVAFPSVSASYVLVLLVAHLWFHEPIVPAQIAGVVLIMSGITLLYWRA
ncbi:MAG: EamA family transporter [Proteobacteria bacterium]|nr:EamA family transporter [Pseudomonadota bacterium]MBI3499658.1 EamA family transporter [Pseudomonadota bacterium]